MGLWFLALNMLDPGLTLDLVGMEARETTPIIAALLDAGWEWAAISPCIASRCRPT